MTPERRSELYYEEIGEDFARFMSAYDVDPLDLQEAALVVRTTMEGTPRRPWT